jgi:hypothetical protein
VVGWGDRSSRTNMSSRWDGRRNAIGRLSSVLTSSGPKILNFTGSPATHVPAGRLRDILAMGPRGRMTAVCTHRSGSSVRCRSRWSASANLIAQPAILRTLPSCQRHSMQMPPQMRESPRLRRDHIAVSAPVAQVPASAVSRCPAQRRVRAVIRDLRRGGPGRDDHARMRAWSDSVNRSARRPTVTWRSPQR